MNYGEIKKQIISRGFAEASDFEEYEELGYTYDAINRAISEIGVVYPRMAKYEFEIDDTDTGYIYLDFSSIDKLWLDFTSTPVLYELDNTDKYISFADYEIEMGNTLVINADENKGSFRVYYKKQPTKIDSDTEDSFVPDIPLKVHHTIPLLASYYLWLDDDATKASQYYNLYETQINAIQSETNKPRMKIKSGGI